MIGKNLQQIFDDLDKRDPKSRLNSTKYSVFILIAQRLRDLRQAKSLSQRALALKSKTTQANIKRWETPGCTAYTISKLVEVADALDSELFIDIVPFERAKTVTADWGEPIVLSHELSVYLHNTSANNYKFTKV